MLLMSSRTPLQCDCIPGDSPAMSSANLYRYTGTLFLSGFNHEHAADCPVYRPFSSDVGATSSGTRKHAGSRRINYRNFLPPDDTDATTRKPGHPEPRGDNRTRRIRRSRIARLLLLKMPALTSWTLSFLFLPGEPGNP